ncbi:1-phosphatidylinositol 3-phosphate 5-kinase isoform 7-T8 [Pholidichthys leucotaenia]
MACVANSESVAFFKRKSRSGDMAADDKSSSSSSTDWSIEPPALSPASPSHLTHFKPLTPEQDEPPLRSAYSSFVSLFRFNNREEGRAPSAAAEKPAAPSPSPQSARRSWSASPSHSIHASRAHRKQHADHVRRTSTASEGGRGKTEASLSNHDPRTAVQLRTALKRLKEIMEGKSQDSDLKQYWMPDSQCKECYDCNEKFTTFRRRHHCRLCGQIFCSRCCNQEIPGKFMGYTGDLRACTYCRKIALSYAHSADSGSIGEDLTLLSDSPCSVSLLEPNEPRTPVGGRKASRNIFLEEDLAWQSMIHQEPQSSSLSSRLTTLQEDVGKSPARKRSVSAVALSHPRSASVSNLSLDRSVPSYDSSVSPPTSRAMSGTKSGTKLDHSEEERKILLDSSQLKDLWKKICHNSTGMEFQDHRYWLRTYPNCIVGKELVNWLLRNGTISTRAQAIAIGQALVDGRWLDCVTHHDQLFRDEYALYRPLQSTEFSETPSPDSDSVNSLEGHSEPSWFKDIKVEDSDMEQLADDTDYTMPNSASPSKKSSVSSFHSVVDSDSAASINLNMEQNNVNFHIKKQPKYPHLPPTAEQKAEFLVSEDRGQNIDISDAFIKESLFNRRVEEKAKEMLFTPLGWHHSSLDQLREENGEKKAMERLLSANHSHMMALLQQLLYSESLSLSWRDIVVPVVQQVVQTVRPDVRNCDNDMDIRQLVHIKKIPGGKKFDSTVVNGFVCTKNIAHKKMNPYIKNPKILMLQCSIEYLYREETKFTSIDPIVLQEREFLKNYVQRIVDVRPNLVLVEKTVSRIAQEMLLEHGITLVINVKSLDCLNPANHQSLCVLFSSSSVQSNNAPNPCVNPWLVTMEFYGKNDLSLGVFLERYCFRPSYQCPNMFCETPMVHHVRRFVHCGGCVQIVLKELDSPVPGYQHTILNYSWCRICKQVTPVVPLSNDSWCMSFAKYLELRFYGHQYTRRANAEPCGHSIHKDYHQYFSYNQMVASFSYTSVRLLEICLPRSKIFIRNLGPSKTNLQQDLKDFSQKVTQVYVAIDDRLTSLKTDTFSKTREEKMEDLFAQKDMEEVELRTWIEKLQVRLQACGLDSPQQLQVVLESLVVKKQSLCEMLQSWNTRLQDLFQQEKGRKRLSVPPSPGRHRPTTTDDTKGVLDASPRNPSPVVQNGDKEDRHLSTLSSSSAAAFSSSLLPSPGDLGAEPATLGSSLNDQDSVSIPEDVFDGHLLGSTDSQVKEKSTMKAILANFLPGNSYNPIPFPFDPDKHYLMYEHERVPIAVCEREPSSIIAFALSCKEYKTDLEDLSKALNAGGDETPHVVSGGESRVRSSPARPSESASLQQSRSSMDTDPLKDADSADKQKKQTLNPHIELQFSDANAKFYCRIYYAEEFHKMREVIMESSEEDFVRSLSHCVNWQARGGKSGAVFYATEDDRFILKQMPRLEVQSFLDFAPHYFTYITGAVQQKRPTALAKILGVYRIGYKNSQNNTEKKLDLLVMENLFYGRKMAQVFDLKGSLRNRNVKTDSGKESCEVVLLDENLLKLIHDNPLYIRSHCKSILRAAIHSDAYFLSSHLIIDYSLLVGRDDATEQLVVGIIDYIRTFTWDKKLEMVVKSTGILGGQGKMPTVVSPELYRARFCEAMDKYFLMVPDHWTGLGTNS